MTAGRIQKIIFAHIKGKLVREGYVQIVKKAKVDQHQLRFWSDIIDHLASVVAGWHIISKMNGLKTQFQRFMEKSQHTKTSQQIYRDVRMSIRKQGLDAIA